MKGIATALAIVAALAAGGATDSTPASPSSYSVEVNLQPDAWKGFSVITDITFALPIEQDELVLAFEGTAVDSATAVVNNVPWPVTWSWNSGSKGFLIQPRNPLPPKGSLTVKIRSRGSYSQPGGEGLVIYGEGAEAIYSQQRICWEITTSGVDPGYSIVAGTGSHIHGPSTLVNLGLVLNGTSVGCSSVSRSTINAILKNPQDYYVNLHWADTTMPITLPSYASNALRGTLTKGPLKSND